MQDITVTIATLTRRIEELEDERAIRTVLSDYALAVDGNNAEAMAQLYAEDCAIDIDSAVFFNGREDAKRIVTGEAHQSILPDCAHIMGPFSIAIDGDRAVATGYATIFVRRDGEVGVWRQAYGRWELVKRDRRWQILCRQSRSTGHVESQSILNAALQKDAGR